MKRKGSLTLAGLGISPRHITDKVKTVLHESDLIYFDTYTSFPCGWSTSIIEEMSGHNGRVVNATRKDLEDLSYRLIEEALELNVTVAVIGDPVFATTHISLYNQAKRRGINAKIEPGLGILPYIMSKSGLSSYKFGGTVTFVRKESGVPDPTIYEVLRRNRDAGLHTIVLMNIQDGTYVSSADAMKGILELEEKFMERVVTPSTKVIVGSRLGCEEEKMIYLALGSYEKVQRLPLPHIIIIPTSLNFVESETLSWLTGETEL